MRIAPRTGTPRRPTHASLQVQIREAADAAAAHLGCSRSWLIDTLLADCFRINLDRKSRPFQPGQPIIKHKRHRHGLRRVV